MLQMLLVTDARLMQDCLWCKEARRLTGYFFELTVIALSKRVILLYNFSYLYFYRIKSSTVCCNNQSIYMLNARHKELNNTIFRSLAAQLLVESLPTSTVH